jgi:hypothetical protein
VGLPLDLIPPKKAVEDVYWNVMGEGAKSLLPQVPPEFRGEQWCVFVERVFFEGIKDTSILVPKDGLSEKDHHRVLLWWRACLQSHEPDHKEKIQACSYILSLFFDLADVQ